MVGDTNLNLIDYETDVKVKNHLKVKEEITIA